MTTNDRANADNSLAQAGFVMRHPYLLICLVVAAITALPFAVWLDLRSVSDFNLKRQARNVGQVLGAVRSYYAKNVIGRIGGSTKALHNYLEVEGAIPIPATLSIELGRSIGAGAANLEYRFLSDYPFLGRPSHNLTDFDTLALTSFRANPDAPVIFRRSSAGFWDHGITMAKPVIMQAACVACHNTHPDSPKTDWKVGDVRGIETIAVHQPIAQNILSFKWLLAYLLAAGTAGVIFSVHQFRVAATFRNMNDELTANNEFLAGISLKISKYLSPQIYRSIFSGEKDVSISTERKKLTVFFSDIKDFTATTELLQPEELTGLLNEYFTEMSRIAEEHGATIDKFIGDAIVAFFGDPTSLGAPEDARACVRMALDMQRRLRELENVWRTRGLEHPFRARMGINTGYCNVGNFGSEDRMDYTIIGAEANLAARLEEIAKPGGIVMSYETYAHARNIVHAAKLAPVRFKGIAREVVPYEVEDTTVSDIAPRFEETADGASVTIRLDGLDEGAREAMRAALKDTMNRMEVSARH